MRLSASWLADEASRRVMALLNSGGGEALFVGGCVRNALMGLPVKDLDIATNLRPEDVVARAEAAGLRTIPTGIEHGTVTLLAGETPFEVTTYRRDVATDGRRATVAFSDDITEDAKRRDFTMNALYARADGQVVDPLGGMDDLLARRVRFIGRPEERIAEDGLRIVRFFRFHALYGDDDGGLDPDGLAAIAAHLERLDPVSRERIGAEMTRLLGADAPGQALGAMAQSGVLSRVLPGAEITALLPLAALEAAAGVAPLWQRRLASLGGEDPARDLRLSRADARYLAQVRTGLGMDAGPEALAADLGAELARDLVLLRAAFLSQALPPDWQEAVARGASHVFPLSARDLLERHGEGPALGAALERLRAAWAESGYRLDRDALLDLDRHQG